MMAPAIQFRQVSKWFRLNPSRPRSLLEMWVNGRARSKHEEFWALRDVSLVIEPGETVGLIGPNGSGKSTMLKLISRIIDPSRGSVATRGRIASLLELGAGFHLDLSGRENIFLNASILGIPRSVIKRYLDEIIDFAQIGTFIDVPVRNYSSGMAMRLGFAITTTLDPEILLIDEILAVGDHSFQRKCLDRLEALRAHGVTIVFVSHGLDQVQQLCRRAIWMDHGQVRADGEAESVVGLYLDAEARSDQQRYMPKTKVGGAGGNRWGTFQAEITSVEFYDRQDQPRQVFHFGELMRVRMHYRTQQPVQAPSFGLAIYRSDGFHLNGPNATLAGLHIPIIDGCGYVDYVIEQLPLAAGQYELSATVYNHDCTLAYDHQHRLYPFEVQNRNPRAESGTIHIPATWQHTARAPDIR